MKLMPKKHREEGGKVSKQRVVSFRVNAGEWEDLKRRSRQTGTTVSRMLRANLSLLLQEDRHGPEV